MTHITGHELQLGEEIIFIDIYWSIEQCSCTSEYGDQTVTEKWEEATAVEAFEVFEDGSEGRYFDFGKPTNDFERALSEAVYDGTFTYNNK
tara:strand:- start:981 stop:1253 length:273 start_codon:yes stop_codon:yes gene_type:complete